MAQKYLEKINNSKKIQSVCSFLLFGAWIFLNIYVYQHFVFDASKIILYFIWFFAVMINLIAIPSCILQKEYKVISVFLSLGTLVSIWVYAIS